jgi:hypothetical protein
MMTSEIISRRTFQSNWNAMCYVALPPSGESNLAYFEAIAYRSGPAESNLHTKPEGEVRITLKKAMKKR